MHIYINRSLNPNSANKLTQPNDTEKKGTDSRLCDVEFNE